MNKLENRIKLSVLPESMEVNMAVLLSARSDSMAAHNLISVIKFDFCCSRANLVFSAMMGGLKSPTSERRFMKGLSV